MAETQPVDPSQPTARLRAIAFGAGGFDSVLQLGVVHALMVARGAPPDYVAGISAGAITAAALAEILQTGEELPEDKRRDAQVDRFRNVLASYRELPSELLRSILPDAYEVNARRPLAPVELPIHFQAEREARTSANNSRAGLIRVMNRLLDLRLPVSACTVIVNRLLRWNATAEKPAAGERWRERLRVLVSLWLLGFRHTVALAPTAVSLTVAALGGRRHRKTGAGRPASRFIGPLATLRRAAFWALIDPLCVVLWPVVWLLVAPLLALVFRLWPRSRRPRLLDRVLEHYDIAAALGNNYALRQQLTRCFDPEYFGKPDMDGILDKALAHSSAAAAARRQPKTLAWYSDWRRTARIHVAPIAAEVRSGKLKALPQDVPVVDALLAATAIVPIFPAVDLASRAADGGGGGSRPEPFIDGRHVSAEPVGALIELLRSEKSLDDAAEIDIYPLSNLVLGTDEGSHAERRGLLQVARRALELQSFRDATIEQQLTTLYGKALPGGGGARVVLGKGKDRQVFVRAQIREIALDRPVAITRQALAGRQKADFDELVYQAVADGCRAALEAMVPDAIATAARAAGSTGTGSVSCSAAMQERLRLGAPSAFLPGHGAAADAGPGLDEICSHCALLRPEQGEPAPTDRQKLRIRDGRRLWPAWPAWPLVQDAAAPPQNASPAATATPLRPAAAQPNITIPGWPLRRHGRRSDARPLVSLLFGGGVFRGVFHMGVMNALNELGVEPDLVAGSSVGSIIAAMIAQAFSEAEPARRHEQIANLAATFLAIDQLVMTDRLADLIRGLTLRAGDTPFSLRDLDLVLRRYDLDPALTWSARTRRVVSGLERLFYVNPIELSQLVRAARDHEPSHFASLLGDAIQAFLDRSGVGQEMLGTEPLALLIDQEVIAPLRPATDGAPPLLFDAFHQKAGIHFLATATNLSRGRLEILGLPQERSEADANAAAAPATDQVSLLYGLLASSAFPGVFRPRQSWEIFPSASKTEEYIDGGTMDNLPLDAVARFLDSVRGAARRPCVDHRAVPHLLFTASLEVDRASLADPELEVVRRSFLRLRKHARTFSYNRKIDAYAKVQRDLRLIHRSRHGDPTYAGAWQPLDLHLVAVRPRWLCNTFGFHPMLGFRRQKQAENIAHGCASTFAAFFVERQAKPEGAAWTAAWGLRGLDLVDERAVGCGGLKPQELNPDGKVKAAGQCWFRHAASAEAPPGTPRAGFCPFSREELSRNVQLGRRQSLLQELPKVYEACRKPRTHLPSDAPLP